MAVMAVKGLVRLDIHFSDRIYSQTGLLGDGCLSRLVYETWLLEV
jgi:hypothetical protein